MDTSFKKGSSVVRGRAILKLLCSASCLLFGRGTDAQLLLPQSRAATNHQASRQDKVLTESSEEEPLRNKDFQRETQTNVQKHMSMLRTSPADFVAADVNGTRSNAERKLSGTSTCIKTKIDFSKDASGNLLSGGMYLEDEFKEFGLMLSSFGGSGDLPRLYDTSLKGNKKNGFRSLGSPNKRCRKRGPGRGEGGEPDMPGANCKFLGNVLTVEENNGGAIIFDFSKPVKVRRIGLLDIDDDASLTVVTTRKESTIDIPRLGANSAQVVLIRKKNVLQLRVNLSKSGAVTFLKFCYSPEAVTTQPPTTSAQTGPPTEIPASTEPSASPTTQPPTASSPTGPPTERPASTEPSASPTTQPPTTSAPRETPASTEPSASPMTHSPTTSAPTETAASTEPSASPTTQPPTTSSQTGAPTEMPASPTMLPPYPSPVSLPTSSPTPTSPTPVDRGGFSFLNSVITASRSDAEVSVNVVRTRGSLRQASIDYATEPFDAMPGDDYTAQRGTLFFERGETEKAIVIPLLASASSQPTEEFSVTIDNPVNAELFAPRTCTVVIEEIDASEPLPSPGPEKPDLNITSVDLLSVTEFPWYPIQVAWLPDNSMLIASKFGQVYCATGTTIHPELFIDIGKIVNHVGDRGLVSMAVHPDFDNSPYVYLFFTYEGTDDVQDLTGLGSEDGGGNRAGRLIRVTANAATSYRTHVPGSEVILLGKNSTRDHFNPYVDSTLTENFDEPQGGFENGEYVQDFINSDSHSHTVGALGFLPDGSLVVSTGDGASYNQVDVRALRSLDINSLAGKVLRIDPISGQGLPTNPFFDQTGNPDANSAKVYQMGIRNSFRMAVSQDTGQIYLGEVGWYSWEEINTGEAGANFGWPYYEGGDNGESTILSRYADTPEGQEYASKIVNVTAPSYAINHDTGINAIVLGSSKLSSTYYGSKYQGNLFFNDLGQGVVRHISFDDSGNVDNVAEFTTGAEFVVSISEGPDGMLYYCKLLDGVVGRWEVTGDSVVQDG